MKITDVLEYAELVLAQYGNIEVVVFTENPEKGTFTFNEPVLDLLQVPLSRLTDKNKLVVGFGFGKDIHYHEDEKIKEKPKIHLRLVVTNDFNKRS
jgi:hypothetical protein